MRRATAVDAVYAFASALSQGDVSDAAACFTREGCLITPDGTAVHGRSEIAAIVAQMVARRTEIDAEQLVVRTGGDVGLASGRFTMRFDGPEGARLVESCAPTLATQRV